MGWSVVEDINSAIPNEGERGTRECRKRGQETTYHCPFRRSIETR
jgi:hypothetical protein